MLNREARILREILANYQELQSMKSLPLQERYYTPDGDELVEHRDEYTPMKIEIRLKDIASELKALAEKERQTLRR